METQIKKIQARQFIINFEIEQIISWKKIYKNNDLILSGLNNLYIFLEKNKMALYRLCKNN